MEKITPHATTNKEIQIHKETETELKKYQETLKDIIEGFSKLETEGEELLKEARMVAEAAPDFLNKYDAWKTQKQVISIESDLREVRLHKIDALKEYGESFLQQAINKTQIEELEKDIVDFKNRFLGEANSNTN